MKTYPPQPIEVLTPQGAGLFAGRTPEAVRVAVEKRARSNSCGRSFRC